MNWSKQCLSILVNISIAKQSHPFILRWTGSPCCCYFLQSCVNYLPSFDLIIKACLRRCTMHSPHNNMWEVSCLSALLKVCVAYDISSRTKGEFVHQSNTGALKKTNLLSFWDFYRCKWISVTEFLMQTYFCNNIYYKMCSFPLLLKISYG